MHLRLALLATVVLAAACGPSHKKICSASIEARAEGRYRDLTPDAAKAADGKHRYSCLTTCRAGYDEYPDMTAAQARDQPSCVEAWILTAEVDPDQGIPAVDERCGGGRGGKAYCDWLAAHPDEVAAWQLRKANPGATATAPPRPSEDPATARAAVARAVAQLVADSESQGLPLVTDETYSLADGGEVIELALISDTDHQVQVCGSSATRFTAKIGNPDYDSIELSVRSVAGDVFCRAVGLTGGFKLGSHENRLYLRDDGGDRGVVRVLVFRRSFN
ncbi:MAG: hypothetical protein IT373_01910 [Polyangiaceae bacterium]|nr:hypothetical protein [Polyangiaceae bacterium]